MAASDNLHPAQFTAPTRLPTWGHLRNGDTIVGLNGAVAHNVKHDDKGIGYRRTSFDYSHHEPGWSGSANKNSDSIGPHVYRPEGTMTGMKTMQSPSTSRLPRRAK